MNEALTWFDRQGWKPLDFQVQTWSAYLEGHSGLLQAPPRSGKTLALAFGPLLESLGQRRQPAAKGGGSALARMLWITAGRALAAETAGQLTAWANDLGVPWSVRCPSTEAPTAQQPPPPSVLVATPEDLPLMASWPDCAARLKTLRCVVVDEWHELLGTKRGTQVELVLARLRGWCPDLRTWGAAATVDNLEQAMLALLGPHADPEHCRLIRGELPGPVEVETVLPPAVERFTWPGHLGTRLVPAVAARIERARQTLLFVDTRAQAELWFDDLTRVRPELAGHLGLHHPSLHEELRQPVEKMLKDGRLRAVVCASRLDLSMDLPHVDQVIQVGSPKAVARLLQRAGRARGGPGTPARLVCVPTHALELLEFSAARVAIDEARIEARTPLVQPLDVLVRWAVTIAVAGGFDAVELGDEVRRTFAYQELTRAQWQWVLEFAAHGGPALESLPQYARVRREGRRYIPASPRIAVQHRVLLGTLGRTSELPVRFLNGRHLGTVEEAFMSRMHRGDSFLFAGRHLLLVRMRDRTAYVRLARGRRGPVPRWPDRRLALSPPLADAIRRRLDQARLGVFDDPELAALQPLLELQARWSRLPGPAELLIELIRMPDGHHHFLYPFQGRAVHEALGAMLVQRLRRTRARVAMTAANDYGLQLRAPAPLDLDADGWRGLLAPEHLREDLLAAVRTAELARRRFPDIARVAGVVFTGQPPPPWTTRRMQAPRDPLHEALVESDPANLLLEQAQREVLERRLEAARLGAVLATVAKQPIGLQPIRHLTPLAFPLWADWVRRRQAGVEPWELQVRRMAAQLERAAVRPRMVAPGGAV